MQNWTIRKVFESFEFNFEPFERDSKNANANSNHSKGIRSVQMQNWTIRKVFDSFELNFEPFESMRMQILIIRKGF